MANSARTMDCEQIDLIPYEWPGVYYYGEDEAQAVRSVVESRSPFRFYGFDSKHFADRLEAMFCERLGRRYALAVNSGTASLSIAMAAIGVGPGDEVLLPGYLWTSCLAAVVRAGAIPRLVDVDDTFCMDRCNASLHRNIWSLGAARRPRTIRRQTGTIRRSILPRLLQCLRAKRIQSRNGFVPLLLVQPSNRVL